MTRVHARFDCQHEREVDLTIEHDVQIPDTVRGLGKCPECSGETNLVAVGGIAPQPGNRVVLDSILMMPVEG
jgi:hypothetical protein